TLNENGGTINAGNVTSYTYGTGATLPTDVTKTDYKFRGWYSNEGLTEGPVTAIGTTETGNKTFWAKWEETSYSNYRTRCDNYWYVTYNANGKEIAESLPTDDYGYGDDHTADVILSTTELHTTGYTHIGWNTDPDATEALESPHTITGNTTFYAIWTPQVYTISYKDQGNATYSGSNLSSLPTSHTYNTATNLVAGVKDGARFEGWYKDASCTEGPVTTLGATEYTGNITLYAKWTAVYAITYTIPTDGGTLATDAQTSAASGETVTMPGLQGGNQVPAPYDCETLIGWTTSDADYESKAGAMPTPFYAVGANSPAISGATTFYAVYSRPGKGPSGTATLSCSDISTWRSDILGGSDNKAGTSTTRTASDGTSWTTTGGIYDAGEIQLKPQDGVYIQLPTVAGNIDTIYIRMSKSTCTNACDVYAGTATSDVAQFRATSNGAALFSTTTDAVRDKTITISEGSYTSGYITTTGGTSNIHSIVVHYGSPAIISTELDCSTDILEFTVTYNANSGQFSGATTTCTGGTFKFSELPDNKYTICSDATCEGMTLVGWNSQMDGQGGLNYTPGEEISSVSQDEFTLYAQFAYNVTVKDNDDFQEDVHPSERGGSINLNGGIDVCSPAKYDFIGWTTDNPTTWKQTITSPNIFSPDEVTTYTPTAVGTQVTAVYGMSTSVGSQAFYISYNDGSTVHYLKFNGESVSQTTNEAEATAMYRETINSAANKYHLYYMNNGVKTYFYYSSNFMVDDENPGAEYGWVITTDGAGVSTFQSMIAPTRYLSYYSSFTTHALDNKKPLTITTGAKEYKYYDETTCTAEITITFNAGGGTMDPVTTQIVGHTGDVITVPTCSYPGWTFLGWVNTPAEAQTDIKKADDLIYTNEDGHEYTIGAQSETLYAYYTKTPVPPTFDGEISDVWKIYVTTVDGGGNDVYHYESGSKDITNPSAHGEYATTTRCIEATDWAFTNVGTNQFTIQNPHGLYLNGDPAGDENDIYFSANPSVWTMEAKANGFYKFVNVNTPTRYLAFQINNGPTFINTSTANENNSSYSYVKVGGCTAPVYTTSPGGEFKLNMLGNVRVTSTNGKTVRSVDALSISADNLTPNTAITLTDDLGVLTFCNATGAALSLTTDANGKLANTAVYVKYTPTAYNTTIETPTITATCGEQHQNFAGLVTGRSLPEKFIIAQKVGDDWYALPNNMTNSQTNPAAVKISAVNETTGTATIYSDVTDHLAWTMDVTTQEANKNTLEFVSALTGYLKVAETDANTIGQYAKQSGVKQNYTEFLPATTDLVDYTLYNNAQSKYVGINSTVWGVYSDAATVRFLVIDQQPAATITWQNEMLGTQHAQNAAEDGVITLPTGDAPVACERAIEVGWVFFGWGDQIDNTKTATPTILVGGEVAKADKTYYAIFRRGTENVWRTSCPTVNTITYTANGGEGTDYVVYTEHTTATAITVETAGFTKEGSQFIGWTVAGSGDNLIQPGGTISGINSDITVNAQWMGELVISGDVQLTSAVGQKVATATTGITFSSTDMSYATALRITYRDETNGIDYNRTGDHSYTSSEFRLCDGSSSYAVADESNISLAGVTGAYEQTYSISYKPNGDANTLDHYKMKVEVLHSSTVIATVKKDLYGRTLPEKFAIVAHVGDMWYALPNNMANSGTYAPVAVSVNNSDASILNWTATGAKTAGYSMKAMTADYNKLRFAAIAAEESNQKCLWASTSGTGIQNYSYNSTDSTYRWTVTPQDVNFQAYTLVNEKNTQNLRYWSAKNAWGMYASGETNLYFIPLTDMEVADFQVIEWFANKVLIETNNQTINTSAAKTSVGSGEYAPATVDGTTYGANQYTLTTGDLTTSAGQPLNIQYQTTAGDAWYINRVKVPIIVSQGEYATSTDLLGGLDARSNYKDNDLVVRDGATLTVDAATGTWNTFKNVTIYPTSKVVVPAKASDDATKDVTMTTTTTTLFGGIDEIYDGSKYSMTTYAVPQLVLKGKLEHEATVQGLRYDIRVDNAIYYDFALPYESMYELVSDHKGAYDYKYWVKNYDGAARATGATGWTWYDWNADPWKINIGTGYLLAAQSKVNQNYVIMRHPMGYYDTGEDKYAKNPKGHQTGTAEETKAAITVKAYPSSFDSNVGWNFIANPFMANFQLDQDGEETGTIKTGELVEHKVNGKWDGHYDWADNENKNVRYVTTYSYETGEYTQHKMSETALPPFTGFFVQIAKEGSIVFDISGRANAAPARMLSEDELPSEMEITLKVNGQNESDETVMLLTKDLSRSNAREFPDEQTKMVNDGILNYYTYGGEDTKMYANGMNYEEGQEWNKAGIMVKIAGEYTFSVNGVNKNYVEQVVLRDMDLNTEYDLMSNDAKIYLDKGEMNDRFYVKIVFGKHNIGTGITERYDTSAPEKFILNDHMYIRANGVLFDGVGKRVKY
ncbi:MAG: InlB B-repeat-containing protein, partial [Bacteroidales bacterium]|nr:InlB B-repeat-containing protein [Candidatus Colicola caccequi]